MHRQQCDPYQKDPGHAQEYYGEAGVCARSALSESMDGGEGRPGVPTKLGEYFLKPCEQDLRLVSAAMRAEILLSKGLLQRQEEREPELPSEGRDPGQVQPLRAVHDGREGMFGT